MCGFCTCLSKNPHTKPCLSGSLRAGDWEPTEVPEVFLRRCQVGKRTYRLDSSSNLLKGPEALGTSEFIRSRACVRPSLSSSRPPSSYHNLLSTIYRPTRLQKQNGPDARSAGSGPKGLGLSGISCQPTECRHRQRPHSPSIGTRSNRSNSWNRCRSLFRTYRSRNY
jgi:hypothetical protein